MNRHDRLTNAERPAGDRPSAAPDETRGEVSGYWAGPASLHALHWRARAVAAEALVDRLRLALASYRLRP